MDSFPAEQKMEPGIFLKDDVGIVLKPVRTRTGYCTCWSVSDTGT
jgi:hypothetical protein